MAVERDCKGAQENWGMIEMYWLLLTEVVSRMYTSVLCMSSRSVVSSSLGPHGLQPTRLLCPWNSPGQNTGVGSRFFLLGIFPTQGLNPGLQHCGRILYLLSHQGSPVVVAGRPLSVQALVVVHTGFVALQLSCSSKEDIQNFLLNQAFLSTLGRVLLRAPHSDSGPFLHCALLNSAYIGSSCQDLWLCGCHSD